MAALTPTVNRYNMGSVNLIVARFTDVDDADTWASGLANEPVAEFWTVDADNPTTQASVGCAVAYSAGTFTLYPAEDNKVVRLFVLIGGGN